MHAPTIARFPSVLTRLNLEWDGRYADRHLDLGAAGRWTGSALLAHIHDVSGTAQDELLTGLLTAARGGDRGIERVLLQALLPAATRIATRTSTLDHLEPADRIGCAISAVWEAIRTLPTGRPTWVMLQLTRAAHAALAASAPAGQDAWERGVVALPDDVLTRVAGAAPAPISPPEVRLHRLLADAVRSRVIRADDAEFLLRSATDATGTAGKATETGVTDAAVRKRRERLRRRLTAAYADGHELVAVRRRA